jgi:hypothetical protein
MKKFSYSTNWMGPVGLWWYEKRGLLNENKQIIEHYSGGRIDVRGGNLDHYGDELSVSPMRSEDWNDFGGWLDDFKTHDLWTLQDLVEHYEQESGRKIRWADNEQDD